ncbi:MAG: metallophosphoesterase, partial [Chloroflexi bacterium]
MTRRKFASSIRFSGDFHYNRLFIVRLMLSCYFRITIQVLINENLYNHLIRLVYNRTNILIEGAYMVSNEQDEELLYFWAFGDLHYRARDQWHAMHARRLAPMFQDVRSLWLDEGAPAFCVSPGDIVDTGARENYTLATKDIAAQLGNIAFYPGIGNHEFHAESREDTVHTAAEFSAAWDMPVR